MNTVKNQKILIDSCILIYCGSEKLSESFKQLLRLLTTNNNSLAISELCGFEVLKNCQNKQNIDYYFKLIDYLHNVKINKDILIRAARLYNLYSFKKEAREHMDKFDKEKSTGDLIIGSTAIQHNSLLLTSNLKDFPLPYWEIVAHDYMVYEHNSRFNVLNRYLLKFNSKKYSS